MTGFSSVALQGCSLHASKRCMLGKKKKEPNGIGTHTNVMLCPLNAS